MHGTGCSSAEAVAANAHLPLLEHAQQGQGVADMMTGESLRPLKGGLLLPAAQLTISPAFPVIARQLWYMRPGHPR